MKQHAPATARNREPILAALRDVLPAEGLVLEISSGTGEHAVHFARALPGITWQPSDRDENALESIAAHLAEARLPNLEAPLRLDATESDWGLERADTVVCINMIHIAPMAACLGLLEGAARLLPEGAPLVLYGPFQIDGRFTAESNAAFDASLRARNPAWGVRELAEVTAEAAKRGLVRERVIEMPANNLVVVFRRSARRE